MINLRDLVLFIISENDGDLVNYDIEIKIANFTRKWDTFDITRTVRDLVHDGIVECGSRFRLSLKKGDN